MLVDWLFGTLIDCLVRWLIDWLIDCLISLLSVVLLNMAGGVYQNTVFGLAAKLPARYTGAVVLGSVSAAAKDQCWHTFCTGIGGKSKQM